LKTLLRFDDFWNRQPPLASTLSGLALMSVFAVIDYLSGFEISFAFFYLIPICFVAWYAGRNAGILLSFASALVWEEANRLAGETYASPAIPYWNAATRLGFFLIIVILISSLRNLLKREQSLSRTDALTGVSNRRAFEEFTRLELARSSRYAHPFTLAYVDLDDFKVVNDRFGHDAGDAILRKAASILQGSLRSTDVIARLGGDEFGVLLPETDRVAAEMLISRLKVNLLNELKLDELKHNRLPITSSIGVMTFTEPPQSVDEMVKLADGLMYDIKKRGKNGISYAVYGG
jgi:diguanylate cyclase (GGDEF)-like protein